MYDSGLLVIINVDNNELYKPGVPGYPHNISMLDYIKRSTFNMLQNNTTL